jgi:hypothetical protein
VLPKFIAAITVHWNGGWLYRRQRNSKQISIALCRPKVITEFENAPLTPDKLSTKQEIRGFLGVLRKERANLPDHHGMARHFSSLLKVRES